MSFDPTGYTLAHEHLHIDLSGFKNNVDCRLDQYAFICQEMNDLMTRGVRNVIEMTNRYMGRNAQFMLDVMRETGINVVACTGYYQDAFFPEHVATRSVQELAQEMVDEIEQGIDGTELKTGLLNAWLLFLPTDILGVLAINSLMAFGLGAIWGVLILTCLLPVNQLLTALPVDVLGSLGELSSPVVSAFALFPLVAIFYQFGWKQSLIAAVVVLMTRVVVVRYFPHLNPESIEIFIGMVMLLGIAITHDLRHRDENDIDASGLSVFEERTSRIIKNLPYIAIVGALIAAVASMKIFAGSEVSIFTLEKAYSAGVTPEQSQTLINQAALAEFMRGLGFVPLIATTALATGVYAVAGFTFVYAVGYLSPNPMVAAVLGAVVISAEVLLLRSIGKWLGRYPSVRNASDNIRNAMNMLMEVALLVGSIFAAIKMAGYTGFSIAVAIYFLNESLGRPVQKMAAPVVAVMITGILLNVLYWLGLFVPA
ncbi:membrane protein [Escherichia coli]|nr:membrane protein [Escherichia coli]